MGEETPASSSDVYLGSRATTWTLFVPQHFSIFHGKKKSPKNGSVSKKCVSPNPPKTPTLTRNVFSLDDSIKGSYQGYIPAIQKTLSRVFWGGAKETI